LGAGLSSSAAIEVSTGYALLSAAGHAVDRTKLALLCQRAENEYVGARVGIMDQFVSCHGRAGSGAIDRLQVARVQSDQASGEGEPGNLQYDGETQAAGRRIQCASGRV